MKVISAIRQVSVLRNRSRLAGWPRLPDEIWIHQILPYLAAVEEAEKRLILARIGRCYLSEYYWHMDNLYWRRKKDTVDDFLVIAQFRCLSYHNVDDESCYEYPYIYNLHKNLSSAPLPKNYRFAGVPEWARKEYCNKQNLVSQ